MIGKSREKSVRSRNEIAEFSVIVWCDGHDSSPTVELARDRGSGRLDRRSAPVRIQEVSLRNSIKLKCQCRSTAK